jgi:apolipoprotein N-acyltransferase
LIKISNHFTTSPLTEGLSIALLGSVWLYGAWAGFDLRIVNTAAGILFLYLLLGARRTAVWFWSGFFIGILWFGWIGISMIHYRMAWATLPAIVGIGLIYGAILWSVASLGAWIGAKFSADSPLLLAASYLLLASYLHPLGFDWFKPELVFVHSYLGVTKWQFAIVLLAVTLAHWRRNPLYLGLVVLAYSPVQVQILDTDPKHTIKLVATHTAVDEKWDAEQLPRHIRNALEAIDRAVDERYAVVVLPESVLPIFLNREPQLLGELLRRSRRIAIIIGALYYDHGIHRNSTYLFRNGRYSVANKVLLVPFGEANPLPEWLGRWVNRIFFDGSIDYTASAEPTDWEINATRYRNAICYEATSERLYDDRPEQMIVTSNNAWFVPSVEPTFQRVLLSYYVRKYGTTIYHATNMSSAYVLQKGNP